jgi:hypothetical protein
MAFHANNSFFQLILNIFLATSFLLLVFAEAKDYSQYFPLHGSVFLPHDRHWDFYKIRKTSFGSYKNEVPTKFLATLESVMPILDIAISDAHMKYLTPWIPNTKNWLEIRKVPVFECDDQKRAAWAALEALQWTNGSGLDVTFGPACDYVLASISRILSFYRVPMFTNAGFSEYFESKDEGLLTRVGPLQNHITMMVSQLANRFNWKRPQLMYEKSFWESELHEAGFCKLLMNGMYVWSIEKKWDLQVSPRILPSYWDYKNPRKFFREFLIDNVGVNYGGWFNYFLNKKCLKSDYWHCI